MMQSYTRAAVPPDFSCLANFLFTTHLKRSDLLCKRCGTEFLFTAAVLAALVALSIEILHRHYDHDYLDV